MSFRRSVDVGLV